MEYRIRKQEEKNRLLNIQNEELEAKPKSR